MKGLFIVMSLMATLTVSAQEYKVVTIVESIVPMGLGRSRIVDAQGTMDVNALTTVREGKKSKQDEVDREDVKEGGLNLKETKLLNFYSMMGINFGNVASNDAVIAAKINEVVKEGWSVAFITSGVESDAGKDDSKGIFITRIFFVKK
ncbi:MAG: hypothetical protein IPN36_05715 [Bacteroidetes bacterium]|nr:hypothetical protein [Bacteroidota bacterium]MBK9317525.1 hypothetical protein [Bacteroidota bacterium]MBK9400365.1 hypothetical protein [Bacteroidota bacterium]